jgi:hypothetical protein
MVDNTLPLTGNIAAKHDPEKWDPVFRKDHAQTKALI